MKDKNAIRIVDSWEHTGSDEVAAETLGVASLADYGSGIGNTRVSTTTTEA